MRASQFFISTLKEAPADAEIISHKLMVRTGMIRRLGSGIYAYMPMGLRVSQNRKYHPGRNESRRSCRIADASRPAGRTLAETGRWQKYGPELCASRTDTTVISLSSRLRKK